MTNPDMIHYSILGQVQKVKYATAHHIRNYLRNLKFIVLDEMHMYRGTFGSHVALVLRRLLKVCRELGNAHNIQIITSTATIENPIRLAEDLTGLRDFPLSIQMVPLIRKRGSSSGIPACQPMNKSAARLLPMPSLWLNRS